MISRLGGRSPFSWAILACVFALAYAAYVAPAWEPAQDDQADYLQLAQGISARAEFTRAQPDEAFVAEPHRRPGYPLFLALLCRTVGCGHWQIAVVQAAVFAGVVLLTHALATRAIGPRRALVAAAIVALYLPIAYYAALAMSEVVATALLLAALLLYDTARRRPSAAFALACGAACALLALTRPLFVALPGVLVAAELVHLLARRGADRVAYRPAIRVLAVVLAIAAIVQLPFVAYSYRWFGEPLISTSGTVLFRGYLQGHVTGSPADLDRFATAATTGADDATISALGAAIGLDPVESAEVAGGYRDLVPFETAPDRTSKIAAFVVLNRSLQQRGTRLIAHDPLGYVVRGLTIRSVGLWARDVPVKVADEPRVRFEGLLILTSLELTFLLLGIAGSVALLRSGTFTGTLVVLTLAAVWILSLPFLTEGRYAIPARPLLAIAVAAFAWRRTGRGAARVAYT